jgi:3-methyladenine DNA glycosylase AlkD
MADTELLIRKIKSKLRKSMDGIVSASMREKGLDYRLNFGVNIPTLRRISGEFEANIELAKALWKEEIRELKILATMLYPVESFTKENAEKWCSQIANQEIREQVCMNLFQYLSFASELVNLWTVDADENIRTTGYWLFARLVIIHSDQLPNIDIRNVVEHAFPDISSQNMFLKQSAINVLKFAGRQSPETASAILQKIKMLADSDDTTYSEIYSLLQFEFEYE